MDRSIAGLKVPGEKERIETRNDIVMKRLDTLLIPAMRKHGIDLWLVFSREWNADPVHFEIQGDPHAGVRNAYLFFDRGGDKPEKVVIASHSLKKDPVIGKSYDEMIQYGYTADGIRPYIKKVVEARDPMKIAVNCSPTITMADGLTWTLRKFLEEELGPKYAARMVTSELLLRDWRESHVPEEYPVYRDLCKWTVAWEEEAFSDSVIKVGKTTGDDIHWWMREKALELGCTLEFLPSISIQREGVSVPSSEVIKPGDVLSVDAGLHWINFSTDYKRKVYILKPGETRPPAGVRNAFEDSLKVADILTSKWKPGALGYKVFEEAMEELRKIGYIDAPPPATLTPTTKEGVPEVGIYCHSVGYNTHGIGARVAINTPFAWGDRVRWPLVVDDWYSVELHVVTPVPEWGGKTLRIPYEESVILTNRGVEYIVPRQKELLVV
jgi:Xaa-Pro aminopeptidase